MSVFGAYAVEGAALRVRPAVVLIQPIPRTSEGYNPSVGSLRGDLYYV